MTSPGTPPAVGQTYRILMVASEMWPFAKTGGLGDVMASLPKVLAERGHDVTTVIPRYRGVDLGHAPLSQLRVALGGRVFEAAVYEAQLAPRSKVWLVDYPDFYDREFIYGDNVEDYEDNALRYAFLSKAALTAACTIGPPPDIVHAHDWQAGLVPVYLRSEFCPPSSLASAATVFTIHNLAYQGTFDASIMPDIGLDPALASVDALEFWGRISFLKGGVNFGDHLTTVSPRYAEEIQTPEAGFGFEGILRTRKNVLTGILNGIDTDVWDPSRDPHLVRRYTAETLDGKRINKAVVLARYHIPPDDLRLSRPLIGMVSRMVEQKGLGLIEAIAAELPRLDASIVVHGSGEPRYERMWKTLAAAWPDRIGASVGYDEAVAHRVEAGADLWLMPSRFEPCGLNQMYSQRYGTVPLVRATGGLDDTVVDYDATTGAGTGFKFWTPSPDALLATLRRALTVYQDQAAWRRIQQEGMRQDFSWHRAAAAYERVYARARMARERAASVTN